MANSTSAAVSDKDSDDKDKCNQIRLERRNEPLPNDLPDLVGPRDQDNVRKGGSSVERFSNINIPFALLVSFR